MVTVGETVSHYRILEKLGGGGMGVVYRAHDEHLDRDVALKVLPVGLLADETARSRFRREALTLSHLNHPGIATIHDFDSEGGVDFLIMEYVEGETLAERIGGDSVGEHLQGAPVSAQAREGRKGPPLPLDDAVPIAMQIAEALEEAHEHQIIHRDLKPANVMVTAKGRVKILDFGLAKLVKPAGTEADAATASLAESQPGVVMGTVPYMAPEQLQGKTVDSRADIYGLGTILYEMATGQRPFPEKQSTPLIASILTEPPQPPRELNGQVSPGLEAIILKALAKNPDERYQSAKEVLEDLRHVGAWLAPPTRARQAVPVQRWAAIALASAAALAALAAVLMAFNVAGLRDRAMTFVGASVSRRTTVPPPKIQSLAVLPLENLSGDPQQEYFADGMTEELITNLAKISSLKVISRSSVMQFKGAKKPASEIAKELNVDALVEGSVLREGGQVRITAQLIEASTGKSLWAESYQRDLSSVLALQSEVAQAIAGEIKAQATPQETERLRAARSVDPEVYDNTLKAKAILEYATREGQFRQAIELFQKAVDRDPTYAPAWAGLGEALWSLTGGGSDFVAPGDVRARAIAAAEKALELDPGLPDAHKARAVIAFDGEWDLEKAQQHFEKALELRPNYAAAHFWYGVILGGQPFQRYDEARRHLDQARALDPLQPWNDIVLFEWWLFQGQPEKALEEAERASRANPTSWTIRNAIGYARLLLGQPNQAVPELEAALRLLHPDRPAGVLAGLGLAYGLAGRRADANRILAEMQQASQKRYVSPLSLAVTYSGLGRMDEAFRLLDQALDQRTPGLVVFCTPRDPSSVALRHDPRWKPFIERLRREVRLPPGTPDPYL